MDALLLALLLNLTLDQGSGAQRIAARFGDEAAVPPTLILGLVLAVIANAAVSTILGAAIASLLVPDARLLFLAMALGLGGGGMIGSALRPSRKSDSLTTGIAGVGRYALRRASENAAFATCGIAAFTTAPILTAAGAAAGGCAALILPLSLGPAVTSHVALRAFQWIAGTALLCGAIGCAASALHLI